MTTPNPFDLADSLPAVDRAIAEGVKQGERWPPTPAGLHRRNK